LKNNHINYFKAQNILRNIVKSPIRSNMNKTEDIESSRTI